jgi:hypothetical protein
VVDALAEYRATSAGSSNYTGGLFRVRERNGQLMSPMSFPSRPLVRSRAGVRCVCVCVCVCVCAQMDTHSHGHGCR